MKKNIKLLIVFVAGSMLLFGYGTFSCNQTKPAVSLSISPEAGASYKTGDIVSAKVSAGDSKPDSVVYLIDSVKAGSQKDLAAFAIKTDTLRVGPRLITARLFSGGKSQEISTNIVLLPAKAPEAYTFKVIKTFPHDTSCYTEGLIYQDGYLYESGGGTIAEGIGRSSLRKEDLNTGKILQKIMLDPKIFGEGISIIGDKIIQLTWRDPKIGYVYDKNSFELLSTFNNNVGVEGWGMCFDGKKLYMDDKTNRIWFLDKNTYQQIGYIDVYDNKGAVDSVNELEYINGKIYANVYTTNYIVVIDPKTGVVLQKIDMSSLYPDPRTPPAEVMNGIAYDGKQNRIFVTGKKWPHLYQVEFVKK